MNQKILEIEHQSKRDIIFIKFIGKYNLADITDTGFDSKNSKSRMMASSMSQFFCQEQLSPSQKKLMKKSEKILSCTNNDFWPEVFHKMAKFRQKYVSQIYKLLLFSYQQLSSEVTIHRLLNEHDQINPKTLLFLHNTTQFSVTAILGDVALQIEKQLFNNYNTAGNETTEAKKYKFQLLHFLKNIQAPNNEILRENIVNGTYSPQDIGLMNQIDLLEPMQKLYLTTKNKFFISQESKKRLQKKKRERKLTAQRRLKLEESQKKTMNKRQLCKNVKFQTDALNVVYYLSEKFIENLEFSLMDIPFESIRKHTLANLKLTFGF